MLVISIKKIKNTLTSLELIKLKLLIATLLVGYLRALFYASAYLEHKDLPNLLVAVCSFITITFLIFYVLAKPEKITHAIHFCIISSLIGMIYRIFFLDIFLITQIQTIFIVILWSYYALNKKWGILYSSLYITILPLQVFVNGYYFTLFPETIDFHYYIVWLIFILNTIMLIMVPFAYHYTIKKELINRTLLNNELEESIQSNKDFISTISHELRTPLNSVMGITNLLKEENFNQKSDLCAIHNNSSNLLYLINKILDFNKLDPNVLKIEYNPLDVVMVVNNALSSNNNIITSNALKITTTIDLLTSLNFITTDVNRITLVINNLIEFFLKNSPNSSHLIITSNIFDNKSCHENTFMFMIENISIDTFHQNLILEPFNNDESGLNQNLELAIVQKALENLNQKIEISYNKQNGLNIGFHLPVTISKKLIAASTTTAIPTNNIDLSKLKVLIVDDNRINIMMMNIILKKWNIQYFNANDGYEALEIINKQIIDIVLMDLHMPGISGYETSTEIRNLRSKIKQPYIIAVSASSKEDVEMHLASSGINDFISKPVDSTELKNKLMYSYSVTIS